MFDEHSFLDEITTPEEAHACYLYFINNLQNFQRELANAGFSTEEREKRLRQVWENLINSSKRVGYTNDRLIEVENLLKQKK